MSPENFDFCEIPDSEVDYGIITDAEHTFTDTFSERTIVFEANNLNNNIHNISVSKPPAVFHL